MRIRVETGSAELQNILRVVGNEINTQMMRNLRRACILVERLAKLNVSVNMGELRNSLAHEIVELSDGKFEGRVGTTLRYGTWQEFGTRPHWVPVRGPQSSMGKWIIRKLGAGIRGSTAQMRFLQNLLKSGLWVRGRGGTGQRHFVPFAIAPKLLAWAIARGIAEMKAFRVSGRAQPFLVPAMREALPEIERIFRQNIAGAS